MAVSNLVERADVKAILSIANTTTAYDAWIDAAIAAVSAAFQGAVGQDLLTATYTDETYDGTGLPVLFVKHRPVSAVSSVAIEDESAIDETDDDVFRFKTNGEFWLRGGRRWTKPTGGKVGNVTVTYTAGYANVAAFKVAMPDAWSLILRTVKQWYIDDAVGDPDRRGIASVAHGGGAISYFEPKAFSDKDWYDRQWKPIARKYLRRRLPRGAG